MADDPLPFQDWVERIRAGDQDAAIELIRQYEPLVRREIRMRLSDDRLRRAFDSMDICQSVFASFFARTAAGQFDLDDPTQLVKLLITMARNKLASASREENCERRDHRRVEQCDTQAWSRMASHDTTPSHAVEAREMYHSVMQQLSPEERALAVHRANGLSWTEIANQVGGTADGRRMQLARAVDRVAVALDGQIGL